MQQNFLKQGYFETNLTKIKEMQTLQSNLDSDDYFGLYFSVNQMNKPLMTSKETSIQTKRIGLNARLKITANHFHLMSNPYMNDICIQSEGKYE